MERTAMQEFIEELTDLKNVPHSKSVFDNAQTQVYHTCIALAKKLLTKEREQIVEARLSVTGLNHASPTDDNSLEEAEQYYSSKYSVPTT